MYLTTFIVTIKNILKKIVGKDSIPEFVCQLYTNNTYLFERVILRGICFSAGGGGGGGWRLGCDNLLYNKMICINFFSLLIIKHFNLSLVMVCIIFSFCRNLLNFLGKFCSSSFLPLHKWCIPESPPPPPPPNREYNLIIFVPDILGPQRPPASETHPSPPHSPALPSQGHKLIIR